MRRAVEPSTWTKVSCGERSEPSSRQVADTPSRPKMPASTRPLCRITDTIEMMPPSGK